MAVFKPPGLATIPGRAEQTSLLEQVAEQLHLPCTGHTDPRVRLVHRLDKETSGVLLLALNRDAQRFVSQQFQKNTVEKEYLAICVGQPPAVAPGHIHEIDLPLAVNPRAPQRMMVNHSQGRPAKTLYRIEESFGLYHVVRAFPKTGKTHQIRVHLMTAGLPLAVDAQYHPIGGGRRNGIFLSHFKPGYRHNEPMERPLMGRLSLHAEKLSFTHPDGQRVEIDAPPPKDFRATIAQLRKWSH